MMVWLLSPSKTFAEGAEVTFDVFLLVATAAVVVGLIGEYHKGAWWKRHVHIFEVMVIAGVAGEMISESGAFWYAFKVHALEGRAVVDAQNIANAASDGLLKLGGRVDGINGFVTTEEKKIAVQFNEFKNFEADQKERTASTIMQLDNAKADLNKKRDDATAAAEGARNSLNAMLVSLRAEEENLRRAREALAPRSFSAAEEAAFVATASKFRGLIASVWRGTATTPDANSLAGKVTELLIKAKWKARGVSISISSSGTGIVVMKRIGSPPNVEAAGNAIIEEFRRAGFVAGWQPDVKDEAILTGSFASVVQGDPADLLIFVGSKF